MPFQTASGAGKNSGLTAPRLGEREPKRDRAGGENRLRCARRDTRFLRHAAASAMDWRIFVAKQRVTVDCASPRSGSAA